MRFKVILLTCYPPPFGGVAVLSRRLFEGLKSKGIDVEVASENVPPKEDSVTWVGRYRRWLLRNLLNRPGKETIVHYLLDSWPLRAALGALASVGTFRCVLSVNNARSRQTLNAHNVLMRPLFLRLARMGGTHWIAVSDLVRKQLVDLGVVPSRISTIPSFVRPSPREIETPLPDAIDRFIGSHQPVLSSVAFRLEFHGGEDLYGVDLCIRATQALRDRHPNIGFVFFVPDPGDGAYLAKLKTMVKECGVQEHFLLYDRPLDEACPLWKRSSLFVRATNTDGDPLSVREALFVGTPVVASDVSPRPEPCVLFRNRDLDSLVRALEHSFSNLEALRAAALRFGDPTNAIDATLEVYRRLMTP